MGKTRGLNWSANLIWSISLQIVLPVLVGVIIYAFYRGISFIDNAQKLFPIFPTSKVSGWIKYNLPDALWLYAFLSALSVIWLTDKTDRQFVFWFIAAVVLSISSELFQSLNIISGTFDWKDIISYVCASLICLIVHLVKYKLKISTDENE